MNVSHTTEVVYMWEPSQDREDVASWLQHFGYTIVDKSLEGILVVKFIINKHTDFSIMLYSCYLPPENQERGRYAI